MSAWSKKPLDENEYPDPDDLDDGDDESLAELTPCPHCGRGMFADSPRCPSCGDWVDAGRQSHRRSDKWYVRGGLWATRTLLVNWLFWIGVSAVGAVAAWIRWARGQ